MVDSLLDNWHGATADDLAAGLRWYDEAGATARALAAGTDGRVSVQQAAGVIAALSPRMPWARNVHLAALVVDAFTAGAEMPGGAMRARLAECAAILRGEKAGPSGRKVSNFARAILGDTDAVTVDVWAMRAAGIADRESLTAGQYARVSAAYTAAAEMLGVTPRDLQAAVWVAVRGGAA
jgi:hypothetical protein